MSSDLRTVAVGMGELKISNDAADVLTCLGLGSCIGLSVYDPTTSLGGMVHIVLPGSSNGRGPSPKFADTAVPHLLDELIKKGASKERLMVKMAGGAQMSKSPGVDSIFNTGQQNVDATKAVLASTGLRLRAADTGGHQGRTLRLYISTGAVTVSVGGGTIKEL